MRNKTLIVFFRNRTVFLFGEKGKEMLILLIEKGYDKAFGILGHKSDEDVATVLKGNINRLSSLQVLNK